MDDILVRFAQKHWENRRHASCVADEHWYHSRINEDKDVRKLLLLPLLTLVSFAAVSEAAPIYVAGNECPADPIGTYDRQYYVTQATNCVFDPAVNNITGTDAEADFYLNSAAGTLAGWGGAGTADDWVGLDQHDGDEEFIAGFSYTADAGNDDGTFTFGASLLAEYEQFALAIKDGGDPKWAIFLLPAGLTTGDWGFSTNGGQLSLFALVGRNLGTPRGGSEVPEPTTLLLLGSGLTIAARRRRAKR
jgi:hypothetical protein